MIEGDDPVVVVEGEQCVEILREIGVNATTCAGGAGKFSREHAEQLRGRNVIVWPDADSPGRRHGEQVCAFLDAVTASLRCVVPPDWLRQGGDVVNVMALRGEVEVRSLLDAAKPWFPSEDERPDVEKNPLRAGVVLAADVALKVVEWVWNPYIPSRFITMIFGDGDVRKSWLAMAIAAGITRGGKITPWDENGRDPGTVLYFSGEDDVEYSLARKAHGCDADLSRLHLRYGVFGWDDEYVAYVEQLVEELRPDLVVFDPVVAFESGTDTNEANKVRAGLERLGAIAKRQDCAILLVHHVGKDRARGVDQLHLGSVDYRNASRSTLVVGLTEPESETSSSVLIHRKHNLSTRRGQSIEFTTEEPWQFRWVGISDKEADDLYPAGRSARRAPEALDEVGEWLKEMLKDGCKSVKNIMGAAKQAGLSQKQVRTARERYCKKPRREGGAGSDGHWVWELKDDAKDA